MKNREAIMHKLIELVGGRDILRFFMNRPGTDIELLEKEIKKVEGEIASLKEEIMMKWGA